MRYRARNAGATTLYVFNLCFRQQLSDGRFAVDPNFAYCRVDPFGGAVLYKAVPEIPVGLKPDLAVVPCVSELVPGAMLQEELVIAMPLTLFEGYPVWLGEFLPTQVQSVTFALGYFDPRAAPGTQLYTVQTTGGPARWPYPFAPQWQQVALSAPTRIVLPVAGLPPDVLAVRLQGAPPATVQPSWPPAPQAAPWPQAQPTWTSAPTPWPAAPPAPVAPPAQQAFAPLPSAPPAPTPSLTTPSASLGAFTVDRNEKSSTGLDANLVAAGSYVLGFISGIIVFAIEKQSRFVRFHALQSTIVSLALLVLTPVITGFLVTALPLGLSGLLGTAPLLLQLFLAYKAYSWELFPVPVAGNIAAKQLEKPPGA